MLLLLAPLEASAQRAPSPRAARLLALGDAHLRAGDRGSAIGYFREALAADPQAARAYARLGDAYRQRGAFGDARQVLEAGLARHPDDAELWIGLAQTLEDGGAPEEAAAALRTLLARAPDHAEGLRRRAALARRRGAWSEALTVHRRMIARADAIGLDADARAEARRYEAALRRLARPADPISAPRACAGSALRRALARCE